MFVFLVAAHQILDEEILQQLFQHIGKDVTIDGESVMSGTLFILFSEISTSTIFKSQKTGINLMLN